MPGVNPRHSREWLRWDTLLMPPGWFTKCANERARALPQESPLDEVSTVTR